MTKMTVKYQGGLRNEATHLPSNTQLITDAPLDNKGKGESFSPTDLLCTSLATCMITIMGIYANEHNINIDGIEGEVIKTMAQNPRRVAQIDIQFNFPKVNYSEKEKIALKNAALNCPVAKSIHPDIKVNVVFNFTH